MRALAAGDNRNRRYHAPATVVETTVGALLLTRRSLERRGQQALGAPFVEADRPLWISGNPDFLQQPCVAIVGTRHVTADGARRARKLARELTARGYVIVSGLARGVDCEALSEAISIGGKVIAVIGTPLDRAYPTEHAELQEEIAARHLLVSQFKRGARTFPGHFPERNRVMAALCDATAIIEAGDASGTLHQAAECLRLGRWLFIAKNVAADPSLTWPAKFLADDHTRILTQTADIDTALRS